jgi:transcriptional regulator with XRE-family HTH domain
VNKTPRTDVAANVRAELARARITQSRLAEVAPFSQSSLSRSLAGLRSFTVAELTWIANYLDVPVATLLAEPASADAGSAA